MQSSEFCNFGLLWPYLSGGDGLCEPDFADKRKVTCRVLDRLPAVCASVKRGCVNEIPHRSALVTQTLRDERLRCDSMCFLLMGEVMHKSFVTVTSLVSLGKNLD